MYTLYLCISISCVYLYVSVFEFNCGNTVIFTCTASHPKSSIDWDESYCTCKKTYTLHDDPHILLFQVFDDPHQLIPSYHEYSITNSPTHSYSPTSGDSAGMSEYFISRGASTAVRSGGLGYGSHATEQGDTVFCEPQQRLQEPKVISNESNRVGSHNLPLLYKLK